MIAYGYRATRMPAHLVSEQLETTRATTEADAILVAARTEAAAIRATARAEAAAERARGRQEADEARLAVQEQAGEESRAAAIRDVMATATRLEARFDALSPWLEKLVRTSVSRIVGTLTPDDLHHRLVAEALREARPAGVLRLRVHPDDARATATRFRADAAVTDVTGDPSLAPGSCVLDCEGGLLDLSIAAQLDVVLRDVTAAIADATP
jgi:type III secretion protein L